MRVIANAVIGGNAVAAWVGRVDASAVRFTQGMDLLIRRDDLAPEPIGFCYRHTASIDMFLDGPDARARDALHIIFAGERVRPDYPLPPPEISEADASETFKVLRLDALVRMKLTSFRDKDRMHLRDRIDVGLVDEAWVGRLPEPLSDRLRALLDDPEGSLTEALFPRSPAMVRLLQRFSYRELDRKSPPEEWSPISIRDAISDIPHQDEAKILAYLAAAD